LLSAKLKHIGQFLDDIVIKGIAFVWAIEGNGRYVLVNV
jgi:hypothetical protein